MKLKIKTVYQCTECQAETSRWNGQCSSCNAWNCLEEKTVTKSAKVFSKSISSLSTRKISEIEDVKMLKIKSFTNELDRVLGDGFMKGGMYLLGGEPGIGKSTISLQILNHLNKDFKSLYVAGEESVSQIASRAKRLNCDLDKVDFIESCLVEQIEANLNINQYDFLIIDSIQVMRFAESLAGTSSTIRQICEKLIEVAKLKGITTIIIGHVTKEGELAGPKVLEHLVDVVLYIEGERSSPYRFLKAVKNRFGPTNDVGLFKMEEFGLNPIDNPALEFVESKNESLIGAALTCVLNEHRPLVVEVQALCIASNFGYPKRSAVGFDLNRLNMIIAVLQKYYGIDLSNQDVFVNVSGGLKIKDSGCDLALMKAIISSYKKIPNKLDSIYLGECSLTGKIKPANLFSLREVEMKRLAYNIFTQIY